MITPEMQALMDTRQFKTVEEFEQFIIANPGTTVYMTGTFNGKPDPHIEIGAFYNSYKIVELGCWLNLPSRKVKFYEYEYRGVGFKGNNRHCPIGDRLNCFEKSIFTDEATAREYHKKALNIFYNTPELIDDYEFNMKLDECGDFDLHEDEYDN